VWRRFGLVVGLKMSFGWCRLRTVVVLLRVEAAYFIRAALILLLNRHVSRGSCESPNGESFADSPRSASCVVCACPFLFFCFFKFSNKCCTAACARLLFGFRGFDEVYCTFTFLEGRYTTWCPQRSFYLQHTFLEGIVWDA
jgi:hypothetical protein